MANCFPLSWTQYTRLLRVENPQSREFYQTEALRGGWSVRQLERQIAAQFYERTALLARQNCHAPQGPEAAPRRRGDR